MVSRDFPLSIMFAHIDADSFFASVLQRKYPQYRNKPLIALGMGEGCVIAATYDVKAKGIRTGTRLSEAKKILPDVIAIPSDFAETGLASQQIESILSDQCPLIEQMSIDEWYLDLRSIVGGTPKKLKDWATSVQKDVQRKTHIPVSIGVGPSKLLAKMSSEYRKPSGVTILDGQDLSVDAFLQDRPAAAIPGIGGRRKLHTESRGWNTAYDIAYADHAEIIDLFGKPGYEMQQELQGISIHPVIIDKKPPKSISRCRSFTFTKNKEVIYSHLMHHLSYTVIKMRRHNLMCKWCYCWLRSGDYKQSNGRDCKLPQYVNTEQQLLPYIKQIFGRIYDPTQGYTQVGFALGGLKQKAPHQFSLFEDVHSVQDNELIQQTLDDLHKQFGRDSIMRGSAIHISSGVQRGAPII